MINTYHFNYTNIPCQGTDCTNFIEFYEEKRIIGAGPDHMGRWHEEFKTVWHGQRCSKDKELAEMRAEIYKRADEACNEIYRNKKYKTTHGLCEKLKSTFRKIADEWVLMKCPFYEACVNSKNVI